MIIYLSSCDFHLFLLSDIWNVHPGCCIPKLCQIEGFYSTNSCVRGFSLKIQVDMPCFITVALWLGFWVVLRACLEGVLCPFLLFLLGFCFIFLRLEFVLIAELFFHIRNCLKVSRTFWSFFQKKKKANKSIVSLRRRWKGSHLSFNSFFRRFIFALFFFLKTLLPECMWDSDVLTIVALK